MQNGRQLQGTLILRVAWSTFPPEFCSQLMELELSWYKVSSAEFRLSAPAILPGRDGRLGCRVKCTHQWKVVSCLRKLGHTLKEVVPQLYKRRLSEYNKSQT
jgi:hypothetical protein